MTGKHLKIRELSDKVMGVKLEGNPQKPEPIYFRVVLPFGDVDIARTTDDKYWVHIRVNRSDDGSDPDRRFGKFIDARLDIIGKHASECDAGDFANPKLYHVAVKIDQD